MIELRVVLLEPGKKPFDKSPSEVFLVLEGWGIPDVEFLENVRIQSAFFKIPVDSVEPFRIINQELSVKDCRLVEGLQHLRVEFRGFNEPNRVVRLV